MSTHTAEVVKSILLLTTIFALPAFANPVMDWLDRVTKPKIRQTI